MDAKILGSEPVNGENTYDGITLRQHFAGLAMQGLIASPVASNREALQSACSSLGLEPNKTNSQQVLAALSVNCADALLAELAKET